MEKDLLVLIDKNPNCCDTEIREYITESIIDQVNKTGDCHGSINFDFDEEEGIEDRPVMYSWFIDESMKEPELIISQDLDKWDKLDIEFNGYRFVKRITIEPYKISKKC